MGPIGDQVRAQLVPYYGKWMTPERAVRLYLQWLRDEAAGVPSPPACHVCGVLLRFTDSPSQQLHDWCRPRVDPPGESFSP